MMGCCPECKSTAIEQSAGDWLLCTSCNFSWLSKQSPKPRTFVYSTINPEIIFRGMKQAMKDCSRGAATREETAAIIRKLCDGLTDGIPEYRMSFDELQEHLQDHLGKNRRR